MSSKECVVDLKYMYIVQTEFVKVSQTSTFNLSLFVLPSSAFICSMTWKAKFCHNYDDDCRRQSFIKLKYHMMESKVLSHTCNRRFSA